VALPILLVANGILPVTTLIKRRLLGARVKSPLLIKSPIKRVRGRKESVVHPGLELVKRQTLRKKSLVRLSRIGATCVAISTLASLAFTKVTQTPIQILTLHGASPNMDCSGENRRSTIFLTIVPLRTKIGKAKKTKLLGLSAHQKILSLRRLPKNLKKIERKGNPLWTPVPLKEDLRKLPTKTVTKSVRTLIIVRALPLLSLH